MLFINNLGAGEVVVILMVALLIFGPKKLPELGRSLGKGIREFRKGTKGLMESLEEPDPPARKAPSPEETRKPAAAIAAQSHPATEAPPAGATDEKMVIDLEKEGSERS